MDTSRVEDADIIAHGARLLLDGRDDEAARALATLPFDDPVPATRFVSTTGVTYEGAASKGLLDNSDRIALYNRDGWRCRYCGRKVVVAGVLEILTSLSPGLRGCCQSIACPTKALNLVSLACTQTWITNKPSPVAVRGWNRTITSPLARSVTNTRAIGPDGHRGRLKRTNGMVLYRSIVRSQIDWKRFWLIITTGFAT